MNINRHLSDCECEEALNSAESRLAALLEVDQYAADDEGLYEARLMSMLVERAMKRRDDLRARLYGRVA